MSRYMAAKLTAPLYGYSEADHLAGVSRGTSRRWLEGYSYIGAAGCRVEQPPVSPRDQDRGGVSFSDLVEIVAIGRFKAMGFGVPAVREVVANCQQLFGDAHPLSTQSFKIGGRQVFIEREGALREVLHSRGQLAWDEVLAPFLDSLDYDGSFARRWWPLGRTRPVVIDPDYGYGLPVVAESGVRTEILRERFQAGDSFEQIASDFNVSAQQVESAIQFEL